MSDAPQTPPPADGLSDNSASGLAYLTIIPAIIFLIAAPYNQKPIIKFHAWQCIGLAIAYFVVMIARIILHFIPFVGWIIGIFALLCYLGIFILWLICMLNAFQGKIFKVPVLGDFAAKQAGL